MDGVDAVTKSYRSTVDKRGERSTLGTKKISVEPYAGATPARAIDERTERLAADIASFKNDIAPYEQEIAKRYNQMSSIRQDNKIDPVTKRARLELEAVEIMHQHEILAQEIA